MSDVVIKVENLSKQYRLGTVGTGTLSHDLNRFYAKLRGRDDPYLKVGDDNIRSKKGNSEYVWALKNINFDIHKGEILGIIGRNGAGKSTLLKILSQVTRPTTGKVKMKGRVGALLEVGTGFHPDLTGRENIYINGAILGMRNWEIKKKLDEIIDFAGVERYIDTPVKRYSSGMMVRLGFSVAAHLEPETLIVDEVLAVGDAEFQKKCFGKMGEVSRDDGRTILFVSHNLGIVSSLCSRGIVTKEGQVIYDGDITSAIKHYGDSLEDESVASLLERIDSVGTKDIRFDAVSIEIPGSNTHGFIKSGSNAQFRFSLKTKNSNLINTSLTIRYTIVNHLGANICFSSNSIVGEDLKITGHDFEILCLINKLPLTPGIYYISAYIGNGHVTYEYYEKLTRFEVLPGDFYPTGLLPVYGHSTTLLDYKWSSHD